MKAVLSSLKRAKPPMNTGLDCIRRRLEDRFSSRSMFWERTPMSSRPHRLTEKVQRVYIRITSFR